jgi:carbon-monoxide dehydrogenase large subunit
MAGDAKSDGGRGWVGRSIRRLEDPTLVAGRGRFAGDLPAARWVRFVRSPMAAGRIVRISAPEGALVVTAADLAAVKPIRPMLHKFNYVPISQPVLARGVVRFVGEPVAAVISPSREEAEDVADRVEVEIEPTPAVVGADAALARGAALVHAEAAGNVAVEGRLKTPGFDATVARAHERIRLGVRSHRQNALPIEPRAAHAAWDGASERITLTCATQMPHALRTIVCRSHRNAGIRSAGDRARCRRRFRAENVAAGGVRGCDLAGAQTPQFGGLGGGSARESRCMLP